MRTTELAAKPIIDPDLQCLDRSARLDVGPVISDYIAAAKVGIVKLRFCRKVAEESIFKAQSGGPSEPPNLACRKSI